ncbi:50S ribosomal protein L32 [bacterium]|nr:50S ribosomal protein L32 [bacterium]
MPLPKRRHSNQRTRLRRTHYKLNVPTVSECPRCHAPSQPHHACPSCGYYNGRLVIEIKEKQKAE